VVDTVRTILSPFTKEYRVLATHTPIFEVFHLFKMEADNVNPKIEDVCFISWRQTLLTHTNVEDV
jgi:hypothetical protein